MLWLSQNLRVFLEVVDRLWEAFLGSEKGGLVRLFEKTSRHFLRSVIFLNSIKNLGGRYGIKR